MPPDSILEDAEQGVVKKVRGWAVALVASVPPIFGTLVPELLEGFETSDLLDASALYSSVLVVYIVVPAFYLLFRLGRHGSLMSIGAPLVLLFTLYFVFLLERWGSVAASLVVLAVFSWLLLRPMTPALRRDFSWVAGFLVAALVSTLAVAGYGSDAREVMALRDSFRSAQDSLEAAESWADSQVELRHSSLDGFGGVPAIHPHPDTVVHWAGELASFGGRVDSAFRMQTESYGSPKRIGKLLVTWPQSPDSLGWAVRSLKSRVTESWESMASEPVFGPMDSSLTAKRDELDADFSAALAGLGNKVPPYAERARFRYAYLLATKRLDAQLAQWIEHASEPLSTTGKWLAARTLQMHQRMQLVLLLALGICILNCGLIFWKQSRSGGRVHGDLELVAAALFILLFVQAVRPINEENLNLERPVSSFVRANGSFPQLIRDQGRESIGHDRVFGDSAGPRTVGRGRLSDQELEAIGAQVAEELELFRQGLPDARQAVSTLDSTARAVKRVETFLRSQPGD